ncbi:hypothetical protein [Paenibacillus mendelii]|uniref:Uncharacterized protein n=1 Tax=Paenibacillus mendelii TaxID=206163 RepID=A0ABV6JCB3_9BACL|nr:hypothetical protein [Paenibacillus mendelii]MCQ6561553.1 hypothetical protein [Paenibacillus mendelii]
MSDFQFLVGALARSSASARPCPSRRRPSAVPVRIPCRAPVGRQFFDPAALNTQASVYTKKFSAGYIKRQTTLFPRFYTNYWTDNDTFIERNIQNKMKYSKLFLDATDAEIRELTGSMELS